MIWISVKDRIPEFATPSLGAPDTDAKLVLLSDGTVTLARFWKANVNGVWVGWGQQVIPNVTHWYTAVDVKLEYR